MNVDIRACFYDVQQAILEIKSFFAGQPMLFAAYQADTRTRRATERNLEIIGEAVGRILRAVSCSVYRFSPIFRYESVFD